MSAKKAGKSVPQKPRKKQSARSRTRQKRAKSINKTAYAVAAIVIVVLLISTFLYLRKSYPSFDGNRALEHIYTQVGFGPRIPGSDGHARTRAFLIETLEQYAEQVGDLPFTYTDAHDSSNIIEGFNIVASFNLNPRVNKRVMLAAHWDTRPFADRDPIESNKQSPVPGANDGASGVAVLLELARVFASDPPDIGVDIVLFDLEDMGDDSGDQSSNETAPDSSEGKNPFAIGSAYFAEHQPDYQPEYGILLDMVCDAQLKIPKESNSLRYARRIIDKVWDAADKVGATAFIDKQGQPVLDDHFAFLQRGIQVIDLIHTPFPSYWHTTGDTPDKCSVESLQQVGNVLIRVIYNE